MNENGRAAVEIIFSPKMEYSESPIIFAPLFERMILFCPSSTSDFSLSDVDREMCGCALRMWQLKSAVSAERGDLHIFISQLIMK